MAAQLHSIADRPPKRRTAWHALESHHKQIRQLHLRDFFAKDPQRGERMVAEGAGVYLDYSKNRITAQTLKLLVDLAEESGLHARIDAMFRGEKVNTTEGLPALHVALRSPRGASIFVDGNNVVPQVHAVLDRMTHFSNRVRDGQWTGYTGKRISNVVNIGSGGSHVGPSMVHQALKYYGNTSLHFRFIGNVDGNDFEQNVSGFDPSETLFIVCSKTFANVNTLTNARTARTWLLAGLGGNEAALSKHFVAISANVAEVARFGIESANCFELWDWVGERYSICSAIGLSSMLFLGSDNFFALLDGFHQMDMHYLTSPFDRNLPVSLGLLSIWYNNLFNAPAVGIFPYGHDLRLFPSYVQKLMMESNGKNVTLIGTSTVQHTAQVCCGEVGTVGQTSFAQLLSQGTRCVPCDFIAFGRPFQDISSHHDILTANVLAQAAALAFGRSAEEVKQDGTPDWLVPHRVVEGNIPSNTIFFAQLTPDALGKLIALYEHSVYTQAVIWNINAFDQWGTELGDELAGRINSELGGEQEPELHHDSSTNMLIRHYRQLRGGHD